MFRAHQRFIKPTAASLNTEIHRPSGVVTAIRDILPVRRSLKHRYARTGPTVPERQGAIYGECCDRLCDFTRRACEREARYREFDPASKWFPKETDGGGQL